MPRYGIYVERTYTEMEEIDAESPEEARYKFVEDFVRCSDQSEHPITHFCIEAIVEEDGDWDYDTMTKNGWGGKMFDGRGHDVSASLYRA